MKFYNHFSDLVCKSMENLIVNKKKYFKIFRIIIINQKRDETIISNNTSYTFIEALNELMILKAYKKDRKEQKIEKMPKREKLVSKFKNIYKNILKISN